MKNDFSSKRIGSTPTQPLQGRPPELSKQNAMLGQNSQRYIHVSRGPSAQLGMVSPCLLPPVSTTSFSAPKSFQNFNPAGDLATPLNPKSFRAFHPAQIVPTPLRKNDQLRSAGAEAEPWSRLTSGQSARMAKQVDDPSHHDKDFRALDSEIQGPRTWTTLPFIGIEVPLRVLPATLVISTIASAVCMISVQCQILHDLLKSNLMDYVLSFLYILTLGCMVYCMLASPGLIKEDVSARPDRARKTWLYSRPVYRYDHYCRWLMNCIGLLNHREFMIMMIGLVAIAVAGVCVDVIVLSVEVRIGAWPAVFAIVLHLVDSLLKLRFVGEPLKMHIGLVSRNELCAEWKRDIFWRVQPTTVFWLDEGVDGGLRGKKMLKDMSSEEVSRFEEGDRLDGFLVHDLSVDTHNAMLPETNRYDSALNVRDRGWTHNCLAFWTTPRWTKHRLDVF